jgi:hypothetical protein
MSPVGWEALGQWGEDVARVESLAGGVANDVWSVRVQGHLAVGRLGARSDADLAWETELLQHLDREDLTVPLPVPTIDGRLFADGLVVMTYVEGGPPETEADWRRVADMLRRLHRLTAGWPQRPGWLPLRGGFLRAATALAASQRVAAYVQRLRELGWIEGRTIAIEYRWAEGPQVHPFLPGDHRIRPGRTTGAACALPEPERLRGALGQVGKRGVPVRGDSVRRALVAASAERICRALPLVSARARTASAANRFRLDRAVAPHHPRPASSCLRLRLPMQSDAWGSYAQVRLSASAYQRNLLSFQPI